MFAIFMSGAGGRGRGPNCSLRERPPPSSISSATFRGRRRTRYLASSQTFFLNASLPRSLGFQSQHFLFSSFESCVTPDRPPPAPADHRRNGGSRVRTDDGRRRRKGREVKGRATGQEGSSIAICESAIGQASSDALVGGGKGEKEGGSLRVEEMCMDTTG